MTACVYSLPMLRDASTAKFKKFMLGEVTGVYIGYYISSDRLDLIGDHKSAIGLRPIDQLTKYICELKR